MYVSLQEIMDNNQCQPFFARSVIEAVDRLDDIDDYDCIILDLMIDPNGLPIDEINEFQPYFGWAWLRNYVLAKTTTEERIKIMSKTIIFSKYTDELVYSKWKGELGSIRLVSKGNGKALKELEGELKKILK
jgi:hypothetical protein